MKTVGLTALHAEDPTINCVKAMRLTNRMGAVNDYSANERKWSLLYYQVSGEREYYVGGELFKTLRPAHLAVMPVGMRYRSVVSAVAADGAARGICIDFNIWGKNGEELIIDEPLSFFDDPDGEFRTIFESVTDAYMSGEGGGFVCKSRLCRLFARLIERSRREELDRGNFSQLSPAIKLLEEHPERSFTTAELAALCYVSESCFRRRFKEYSGGLAPLEYRNRLRVAKAEELLSDRFVTLDAVAATLGFYDASHFCRVFKRCTGRSARISDAK